MLGRTYDSQNCSAARALELIGERWSLLIIRDALFRGTTRFADFQRSLDIASNVLGSRLDGFVASGLMERRDRPGNQRHHEYLLTHKGRDLQPVVIALVAWGDRWAAPQGPPVVLAHSSCGHPVQLSLQCAQCGELEPEAPLWSTAGPGMRAPVGARPRVP